MPFSSHFRGRAVADEADTVTCSYFPKRLVEMNDFLHHIPSSILIALTAALMYAAISRAALQTAIFDYASFWPANGFVVGTWLQLTPLQSYSFIPLVLVANLLITRERHTLTTSSLFVVVNATEYAIIYGLIRRFAPRYKELTNKKSAIVITLSAIIGSVFGGVLGGGVAIAQFHKFDFGQYGFEFFKWFISDCLGHLAVIPFMLSLETGVVAAGCLILIASLELALAAFPRNDAVISVPNSIPYISHIISFPCVLLCGLCVGSIGYTTATLLLAVTGVCGIVFMAGGDAHTLFIIVVMVSSLSLMVIDKALEDALEDAIRANNQKSAFMAFLCHELRNPLHAILNINVFLMETPLSSNQHQLCEGISIASIYMSQILNDVLDTSKFEAGKMTLSKDPVDVVGIFRKVALQTKEDLRTRNVEFGVHTGMFTNCEGLLYLADEMRLKQLLNNLLAHAIKVTPPGGRIDCGLWYENLRTVPSWFPAQVGQGRQRRNTCTLCMEVTDSGPEIPPDVAGILFKPFHMNMLETSQEYCGTGLELMGGTIEVMRRRDGGEGSTFTVKLPLEMCGEVGEAGENEGDGEDHGIRMNIIPSIKHPRASVTTACLFRLTLRQAIPPMSQHPPHSLPPQSPLDDHVETSPIVESQVKNPSTISPSRSRLATPSDDRAILIVDDSSLNRKILYRLLRRAGVTRRIEECTNGLEAVDKVRAQPSGFTGVFMDLQMPVMDGTEATRVIRDVERRAGGGEMPIVAVTASVVKEETLREEFGFTAVAPKPFLKADAERILRDYEMA
ncbi:hypothetical protein BC829DRAFT_405811 [Chytridium lagenaria]|nr:hypothetical protein BC829DRAFT_405811 [Chytridium lagenaria]